MRRSLASRLLGRRYLVRGARVALPSYPFMLYIGCLGGVLAGAALARSDGISPHRFALATIVLLVPALAGARLWFVAQHIEAFRADLRRVWRRREGGASLYGGLLFAVAFSVPVLALAGIPFLRFWDAAAITMLVGLIVTRIGCLMNGCCAGRATSGRLGVYLPDHHGRWLRRYPTQPLESLLGLLVLAGALSLRFYEPPAGALFAAVVAAYAAGRLALEPLRESARPERETRVNVAVSALLAVAASTALAVLWLA